MVTNVIQIEDEGALVCAGVITNPLPIHAEPQIESLLQFSRFPITRMTPTNRRSRATVGPQTSQKFPSFKKMLPAFSDPSHAQARSGVDASAIFPWGPRGGGRRESGSVHSIQNRRF